MIVYHWLHRYGDDTQEDRTLTRNARWIEPVLILVILCLGLLVRLEDIRDWEANPDRALYQGEPLLTTFDGYYYLRLSRDLAENNYKPIDETRAVPDCPPRPMPPPLLSWIGNAVHSLSSVSFNWIGAVTPALLGILLFFPVYGIGRFYGGSFMGLSSGLFAIMSFYYVYRSCLGWFDTDCMNVTFAMMAVYLAMKFGETADRRRYLWFAGAIVNYLLFLWWWDQTPQVTTAVALLPLAASIVFFYRPGRREAMIFLGVLCAGAVAVMVLKGMKLPIRTMEGILSSYKYISKQVQGDFPNIGVTISEQVVPSVSEIAAKTTDNIGTFLLSIAGLLFLFWRFRTRGIYIAVPAILACLSFFFAKRFMIFLAPTLALGAGFLISEIWRMKARFRVCTVAAPLIALIFVIPSFQKGMLKTFWPKEPPFLIQGMVDASEKTPADSVIWAWWDHGYPMIYWARRATVNDGQVHAGERSVFNGIPFTTDNYRLSANMMQFFVERGINNGTHKVYKACGGDVKKGFALIKEVLAAGPEKARDIITKASLEPQGDIKTTEDWLRFFFPGSSRPVFLFLDWRLTITSYWWYWLGSWNPVTHDGIHPNYVALYGVTMKGDQITGVSGDRFPMKASRREGIMLFRGKQLPLNRLVMRLPNKVSIRNYHREGGLNLEIVPSAGFGAVMDGNMAESVFNKLFVRHNPGHYFEPVSLHSPSYQIWKVKADSYTGPGV